MTLSDIAEEIKDAKENIFLIYAFNATGKTRLSVAYKENARDEDDHQTGVYYNAFSEDLLVWDNDNIKMNIIPSSLNYFHSDINEKSIMEKLELYKPQYEFKFEQRDDDDPQLGYGAVYFYNKGDKDQKHIKISRGEEHIFIWCFFLALIDVDSWTGAQNNYFFIDDPVSSLDDHNIFITAYTLLDLIEKNYKKKKIIITTHHVGLATILGNWIRKGEKQGKFDNSDESNKYRFSFLEKAGNEYKLVTTKKGIMLYHLRLLQILDDAKKKDTFEPYHLVILRQVLENIASFLGVPQISYVLKQIGVEEDPERITNMINALSHENIYYPQTQALVPDNKELLIKVYKKIMDKYQFVIHNKD